MLSISYNAQTATTTKNSAAQNVNSVKVESESQNENNFSSHFSLQTANQNALQSVIYSIFSNDWASEISERVTRSYC